MTPPQVREFAQTRMDDGASEILRAAVERLDLSARAFHRILKVARTIADGKVAVNDPVPHPGKLPAVY